MNLVVRKGPIFANFILADEINHCTGKVQSRLKPGKQSKPMAKTLKKLMNLFQYLLQNLWTGRNLSLPEAQVFFDRFMLKVIVDYPDKKENLFIRSQVQNLSTPGIQQLWSVTEILRCKRFVKQVYMDEKMSNTLLVMCFCNTFS